MLRLQRGIESLSPSERGRETGVLPAAVESGSSSSLPGLSDGPRYAPSRSASARALSRSAARLSLTLRAVRGGPASGPVRGVGPCG